MRRNLSPLWRLKKERQKGTKAQSMIRQRYKVAKPNSLQPSAFSLPFSRGFTLVEILIAVTLLIVIAAAAFLTFRGGTEAWRSGTAHARRDAEARAVLEMMTRELHTTSLLTGDGDYQIDFLADAGSIHFIASTEAPRPGHPDVMKVRYRLEGGKIRRATAMIIIDEEITDFPPAPADGFPALISDITSLTFRFFDNQAHPGAPPGWTASWRDNWDSRTTAERGAVEIAETVGTLPDMIRIEFTFDDPNDRLPSKDFSTVIVPARKAQ